MRSAAYRSSKSWSLSLSGLGASGKQPNFATNQQQSCPELTGIRARTERCCGDWDGCNPPQDPALPAVIWPSGAEVVRRMASRKPQRIPMTKPKSKPKAATRSNVRKAGKPASHKRSAPAASKPASRPDTKQARAIAMLRKTAGATIAAIMAATDWQQHSVRGFLAGIVRKKLGLNLVSEPTDKGRIYRIKDAKALPTSADRVQTA
jgi:Protein of unknown function (DUF3489)